MIGWNMPIDSANPPPASMVSLFLVSFPFWLFIYAYHMADEMLISFFPSSETDNLNRNGSPEDNLSMSSICKTFLVAPDRELYSITLPSVREESPVYEGQSRLACINSLYGASKAGSNRDERRRLLCRPKPYDAFLDELERQKQEAEREAWRKAKHVKLMER